jgi:hypothetical protein
MNSYLYSISACNTVPYLLISTMYVHNFEGIYFYMYTKLKYKGRPAWFWLFMDDFRLFFLLAGVTGSDEWVIH